MKRILTALTLFVLLSGTNYVMAQDAAANSDEPVVTDPTKKPITPELSPWEQRAAERPKRLWADSFLCGFVGYANLQYFIFSSHNHRFSAQI